MIILRLQTGFLYLRADKIISQKDVKVQGFA